MKKLITTMAISILLVACNQKEKVNDSHSRIQFLKQELEKKKLELKQAQIKLVKYRDSLKNSKKVNHHLNKLLSKKQKQVKKLSIEVQELKSTISKMMKKVKKVKHTLAFLRYELRKTKHSLGEAYTSLLNYKETLKVTSKNSSEHKKIINAQQKQIKKMKKKMAINKTAIDMCETYIIKNLP